MSDDQLIKAKTYVDDACYRGVQAISPGALARNLHCDKLTALRLLLLLQQQEQAIDIMGSIACPECGEQISLRGNTFEDLIGYANQKAGSECGECERILPDAVDLEVSYAFFCRAAAGQAVAPEASESSAVEETFSIAESSMISNHYHDCTFNVSAEAGGQVYQGPIHQGSGGGIGGGNATTSGDGSPVVQSGAPVSPLPQAPRNEPPNEFVIAVSLAIAAAVVVLIVLLLPNDRLYLSIKAASVIGPLVGWYVYNRKFWDRRLVIWVVTLWLSVRAGGFFISLGIITPDSQWRAYAEMGNEVPWVFDVGVFLISALLLSRGPTLRTETTT